MVLRALLNDRGAAMTLRTMFFAVLTFAVIVLFSGCASTDEHLCGGRGYVLRDGACQGFGEGFVFQKFPPRYLGQGR